MGLWTDCKECECEVGQSASCTLESRSRFRSWLLHSASDVAQSIREHHTLRQHPALMTGETASSPLFTCSEPVGADREVERGILSEYTSSDENENENEKENENENDSVGERMHIRRKENRR